MDWQAMVLLGAYHGINPGMGWLFAVALGLQHGGARGVWRALPPIALGHAAAVGVVVFAAALAQVVLPIDAITVVVSVALITLGVYRMWRHGHVRFGGMQVGFRDLVVWSFLMASAHGGGVMVLPFVLDAPMSASAADYHHASHVVSASAGHAADVAAVLLHTCAYFTVMAIAAWAVYRRLGLSLLRTAWFNLDLVWAGALVVAGLAVLLK